MRNTLLSSALVLLLSSCVAGRFLVWNFADTKDHRKFPSRALNVAAHPFSYAQATSEKGPRTITYGEREQGFDAFLEDHRTVAFLVIHRDSLVYERYFKGYDASRLHTSFSMAKSVVSMLVGCAIADGLISGVDQPITRLLPELRGDGWEKVTLEHLLQMTSGLDFNESYVNPFGAAARSYYGRRLRRTTMRFKLDKGPGEEFAYASGNTQLLGMALERALQKMRPGMTLTDYANEKLWAPLGMEYPGSWSIDRREGGVEKAFCCINAPARDFAKLGSLYLHRGLWRGQQLVPAEWVDRSTRVDTSNGSVARYQYQWWLPSGDGDFMAQGILGQFVYVDPARELVIVRLGKRYGGVSWPAIFRKVALLYGTEPNRPVP